MKNGKTELVFILDRSGSMAGLVSDTIGGFNSMIDSQKLTKGDCLVTTVLFDTRFTRLHDRVPLQDVKPLTREDYVPGGCTALLDAMGDTIRHVAHIHKYSRREDVPENVLFVITTDGPATSWPTAGEWTWASAPWTTPSAASGCPCPWRKAGKPTWRPTTPAAPGSDPCFGPVLRRVRKTRRFLQKLCPKQSFCFFVKAVV